MDLVSKSYCHGVNYGILSLLYPNEYPEFDPEDVSDYASRSGDCFITDEVQYVNEYNMNTTVTVYCDCNDPENYDFKDEGKF